MTANTRRSSGRTAVHSKTTVRRAKTPARPQKTRKTVPLEDDECIRFVEWASAREIPLAHIANESRSSKRDAVIRARKLKKMGVSSGVWDYEVWVPIFGCDGQIDDYQLLKIEMKRQRGGGSTVSPEQKKWGKIYEVAGIPHKICYGADEAIAFVSEYYKDDGEVF